MHMDTFRRPKFTISFGLNLSPMRLFRLTAPKGTVLLFAGLFFATESSLLAQPTAKLATLEYSGGGDWYANPTALKNLAQFAKDQAGVAVDLNPASVPVGSPTLFQYDWVHLTGHGNVVFSAAEAQNLRSYLQRGGFLHIDDNYGMDPYIREAMKTVWPGAEWVPVGNRHPLFQGPFSFPRGLPKIHEHDGKAPQAWALYDGTRMVVLYTHESDLSDGWEDPDVHNDPPAVRLQALRMGANILHFVFRGQTAFAL
jgi:hypothetical protein